MLFFEGGRSKRAIQHPLNSDICSDGNEGGHKMGRGSEDRRKCRWQLSVGARAGQVRGKMSSAVRENVRMRTGKLFAAT